MSKRRRQSDAGFTGATQHKGMNLKGALYHVANHLPPNEKVELEQYSHFKPINKSPVSDADVQAIRDRQARGDKLRHVRADYLHITDSSFRNIWYGITKAGIIGKPR
jgi:hypothetical protein